MANIYGVFCQSGNLLSSGEFIIVQYETSRLVLREWQDSDIDEFVQLNMDPEVMRFFPAVYSEEETLNSVKRFRQHLIQYGYTIYACDLKETNKFIGFVGLLNRFDMRFSPCVEIGWRLVRNIWGHGIAVEAANKCLEIAFHQFNLAEIVAFTPVINMPSQRVMQKLGMEYKANFNHYKINIAHPLSEHVLYSISQESWLKR